MKVSVRFYQRLREIVGTERIMVSLNAESTPTIGTVVAELLARHPDLREHLSSVRYAKNGEFADPKCSVNDGDIVDVMPPFSGG